MAKKCLTFILTISMLLGAIVSFGAYHFWSEVKYRQNEVLATGVPQSNRNNLKIRAYDSLEQIYTIKVWRGRTKEERKKVELSWNDISFVGYYANTYVGKNYGGRKVHRYTGEVNGTSATAWIDAKTGQLLGFNVSQTDTPEKFSLQYTKEDCDRMAQETFTQLVKENERSFYQMSYQGTGGSTYPNVHVYHFTKMLNGYETVDTVTISVSEYVGVYSFSGRALGILWDRTLPKSFDEDEIVTLALTCYRETDQRAVADLELVGEIKCIVVLDNGDLAAKVICTSTNPSTCAHFLVCLE